MSAPQLASDAVCGLHARARAVDVCTRCGAFVCASCVSSVAASVYCEGCAARVSRVEHAPAADGNGTLVAAILGVLFPPLALFAGLYAHRRLRTPNLSEQSVSRFRLAQRFALWGGGGVLLAALYAWLRSMAYVPPGR